MPSDLKTSESDAQSVGSIEENELHSSAAVNSPTVSSPERASSVQRYEEEWSQLCVNLEKLRYHALQGDFRASRFRSICWRVLLGVFTPGEPDKWVEEAREARKHYRKLKEILNRHPWSESEKEVRDDNPLSQEAESTWNQYFCDKELRVVIEQDVTRTFPGVDFFRDKDIQNSMVNILFCYAREFPRMCYRQGMHEILAPLIFVTYCDHQAYLHTRECDTLSDIMCDVLNPECLVEDSYMMFRKIMESAGIAYQTSDILPTPTGYFPSRTASGMSASSGENQMMGELNWIRDFLLKPADEKLYKHLQQLDIPLPLFGIRWLRLLFGREFPLQDLLVLWDAIFAEGSEFELVNYIVVAMLLAIGEQLLSSGYTECMNLLMRYPPTSDISYIIKKALHLKDPMLYSDPVMVASQISRPTKSEDSSPPSSPRSPSRNDRPYNLDKKQTSKHVTAITNSIKRVSIRKRRVTTPSVMPAQENSTIIDGYTLQDPSLLKTELKQVQELMKFCRLKLLQYHGILLKQVPTSDNIAQQALVGIHELCSLMDEQTFALTTPSPRSVEIEPAFEVGESSRLSLISPLMTPVTPAPSNQSAFDLPPPKTDVVMKTFKETEGPVIESALIISPSHSIPSSPTPSPSPSSSAR